MPVISVIVPVYKVEKYLAKCVDSILEQSFRDLELILVDDGSPDHCPELCDEYAEKDRRVIVIHKENGGVSRARNTGLQAASGEYVIFCDSDDWMDEGALDELYTEARYSNADVVIGDVNLIQGETVKKVVFFQNEFLSMDKKKKTELIRADLYRTFCPDPPKEGPAFGYGGPWNKLVRKELLTANNILFDVSLRGIFDDILYTAYIYALANRISYRHFCVYNYRIAEGTITHSYRSDTMEVNAAIFRAWNNFFKRFGNYPELKDAFYACVMRRIEESIRNYYLHSQNDLSPDTIREQFLQMIASKPYSAALKKVKLKKISKKQRITALMCRAGMGRYVLAFYRKFDQ